MLVHALIFMVVTCRGPVCVIQRVSEGGSLLQKDGKGTCASVYGDIGLGELSSSLVGNAITWIAC